MKINVAGQVIGVEMITAADGSAFTGSVTALITIDGGTQSASGGTGPTHEGNGLHTYLPTQAETNGDHVAFTFTGAGAIPATVQVYTTFPQTGDNYARMGAPAGASVSADIADIPTVAEFNARTLIASAYFDPTTDTVANVTTVATTANLTNLPAIPANWITSAGIAASALDGKGDWNIGKTGYSISGTKTTLDALNDIAATDIVSAGAITTSTGAVTNVNTVATTTTNTDMRGTDGANTTAPDNAGITANGVAIAALNDLSAAQVNTEMVDVLTVDTYAEPGSVPAATSSIKDKLNWLFALGRNKTTSTSTALAVRDDGDTGDIATAAQSDDTVTYTRDEWL